MTKKKLEKDDYVIIVNTDEKQHGRTYVEALVDQVQSKSGKKIKLKKHPSEDFDEDGQHGTDTKKKCHKLQPVILNQVIGGIRGRIENVVAINLDTSLLTALIKENENEQ